MDEIQSLIDRVRHGDPEASRSLVRMGAQALPAIIEALRGAPLKDALPLTRIIHRMVRKPELPPLLLPLLEERDTNVHLSAFEALGHSKDPRMLQPLMDKLGRYRHRTLAVEAMGELGAPGGIVPLHALARELFGGPPVKESLGEVVARAREQDDLSNLSLLIELATALAKLNDHGLAFIPIGLASFGLDPEAGPEDFTIRIEATKALRYLVAPDLFDTLVKALRDPEPEVRWNALKASLFLGAKRIVPEWIALVRGGDPEMAGLAWSYLHELTGEWPDGIELHERLAAGQLEDWWRRREQDFQEGTCYRLGKPASPSLLFPLLKDPARGGLAFEELRTLTGVDFALEESPLEWWLREQKRFEPGRLYRYGFRHELAEVFQGD